MRFIPDIKPNPTIENVKSGVAAYKASGADYMITIGRRLVDGYGQGYRYHYQQPLNLKMSASLEGVVSTKNRTAFTNSRSDNCGTAAEATINYVITDVERKRKFVCVDTNDIPDVAVVDPDMMAT